MSVSHRDFYNFAQVLLDNPDSTEIDFSTYISLHKKERTQSVLAPKNEFVLDYIEKENPVLLGARYYKFV